MQSLSADPKPSTSNKRICIRSDSGSLYLIVSDFIIRYVLESDQVLVNAISPVSRDSGFTQCPTSSTTTKLTNIERAALARAVKETLDKAIEVQAMMNTDPNYAGYHFEGFDTAIDKSHILNNLKMDDIVSQLDKMNSYLSSTVGLDTMGRIVLFLYEWFGPNIVDTSLRLQKFDPEDNKFGVGFGKLDALIKLQRTRFDIANTEANVLCKADAKCEYNANGKKFEVR